MNVGQDVRAAERRADVAREHVAHDLEVARRGVKEVRAIAPLAAGAGVGLAALIVGDALARVLGRAVVGVAAGIAGGFVMNGAQTLFARGEEKLGYDERPTRKPATVEAANLVAGLRGKEAGPRAGAIAHYAMAAVTGMIYEFLGAAIPVFRLGRGAAYGASVWLIADETVVPTLGLGDSPLQTPPIVHVRAFAAHLVYGVTLDTLLRGVRALVT